MFYSGLASKQFLHGIEIGLHLPIQHALTLFLYYPATAIGQIRLASC